MLHDLAYILRVFARGDEQGVIHINDDEVLHSDYGDKFLRRMDKISVGLERVALFSADNILSFAIGRMLVEGGPGAEVVPSEVRGDAIKAGLALALCGTR